MHAGEHLRLFPRIGRRTYRHGGVVQTGVILESTQTSATSAANPFPAAVALAAPAAPRTWAVGPGLVHLLSTVGPNDLIFNSIVAATHGYSMLWALIPAYALHFFIARDVVALCPHHR